MDETKAKRREATATKEDEAGQNFRQQNERQSTQHGNGIQLHTAAAGELPLCGMWYVACVCVCGSCHLHSLSKTNCFAIRTLLACCGAAPLRAFVQLNC